MQQAVRIYIILFLIGLDTQGAEGSARGAEAYSEESIDWRRDQIEHMRAWLGIGQLSDILHSLLDDANGGPARGEWVGLFVFAQHQERMVVGAGKRIGKVSGIQVAGEKSGVVEGDPEVLGRTFEESREQIWILMLRPSSKSSQATSTLPCS